MPSRPALWKHSNTVHARLLAESVEVEGVGHVWKGYLTKVFHELGISTPYYTHVTQALKQCDALRQLRRGGGRTESEWLILGMPDRELFDWKLNGQRLNAQGTRVVTKEKIVQQSIDSLTNTMLELRHRVERLEGNVNSN